MDLEFEIIDNLSTYQFNELQNINTIQSKLENPILKFLDLNDLSSTQFIKLQNINTVTFSLTPPFLSQQNVNIQNINYIFV